MKRIPNMRVEVSQSSAPAIIAAGGCVSYFGTGNSRTVYAEGKPDHLERIIQRADVTVIGDIHKTPSYRNASEVHP